MVGFASSSLSKGIIHIATPCNLPQLSCFVYILCLEVTKKAAQDGCLTVASCFNLSSQITNTTKECILYTTRFTQQVMHRMQV